MRERAAQPDTEELTGCAETNGKPRMNERDEHSDVQAEPKVATLELNGQKNRRAQRDATIWNQFR